jgi:energy coupling factor transporter S component ThiW
MPTLASAALEPENCLAADPERNASWRTFMNTRRIARATLLTALAVALSRFSIPVGTTKISPTQHMVNVLAAVLVGPWYAVLMAFITSLIRLLLNWGTINAFAGSMIGALLAGLAWKVTRNIYLTGLGEIIGTGILGTLMTVYIVAPYISNKAFALTTIGLAFLVSTVTGSIVAVIILRSLAAVGYRQMSYTETPDVD